MRASLAASTLLLSLVSLPGGPLPALALIALVPLGVALHGASVRQSIAYMYATAFLGWLGSTGGLLAAFSSYAHTSRVEALAVLAVACAFLALPYALFGFLYGRFQWMNTRLGALKSAACLTILVALFPSPLPLDTSHSLYRMPLLVQSLDLGGQPLLLFALYLFNWLCVGVVLAVRDRRRYTDSVAALIVVALSVVAYGYARLNTNTDAGRHARIALVQPNAPLSGPAPLSDAELNPFGTLLDMSARVVSDHAPIDLIVWPELPGRITCDSHDKVRPELTAIVARLRVPFLVNCIRPAPGGGTYNVELLLTVDGHTHAYHKQRLFPLTEYIPGESWMPGARQLFPGASRYVAGTQPTILPVSETIRVIPATCYELLFRNHTTGFLNGGGNVLVSAANDAWFGSSRIPEFAMAASVFQAVGRRMPVVRVSNSGNSAAVSAAGRLLPGSRTPPFTQTATVVEIDVPPTAMRPRLPDDTFLWVLAFAWVVGVVREVVRKRSQGRSTTST